MRWRSVFFALSFFIFGFVTPGGSATALETVEGVKKDLESFKVSMSEKLKEIDQKIEEHRKDTKKESLKEVEKVREDLAKDLKSLQEMSVTAWSKVKRGFAKSMDELNARLQKVLQD